MNQFSYEQELANYLMSSDLPHNSWNAILELYRQAHQNDPSLPPSVTYKRYDYQNPTNVTVIAFGCCSPTCNAQHLQEDQGGDLISSTTLKDNLPLFDFLSTKVNQSFSIHKASVDHYISLHGKLLEETIDVTRPLIITGHSLGGSVASLFTLWLLNSMYSKTSRDSKRPICLTFGSPLLGFQSAVLARPTWTSCFVHVVSRQDPVPRFFTSPRSNALSSEWNFHTSSPYKPFGLFLFCSESGVASFEEPESVLELLKKMSLENPRIVDYGEVLECLKYNAIYKGSHLSGWDNNSFRAGIELQLRAVEVIGMQPLQQNNDWDFMKRIEEKEKNFLVRKSKAFDPNKTLNDRKIIMAYMEWYKKLTRDRGGYYDSYKYARSRSREEIRSKVAIVEKQGKLNQYWRKLVTEADKMPQKEGAFFLLRWLMAGNNYRRMVEPLDIAEYYNQGKNNYIDQGRSQHYVLLEKWLNDKKEADSGSPRRNKACSLTEDSCFWAHLEEASISLGMLKDGESSTEDRELSVKLNKFEKYVMDSISSYSVDPEIFLKGSSFMKWWGEYDSRKGHCYNSPLTNYMRNKIYKTYSNTISESMYG